MNIWLFYSLLCAFFLSLTDLFTKKYSSLGGDAELALGRIIFGLPFLWIFLLIEGIPEVNYESLWVYPAALPLEILATLLYIKALRVSPISLTVPFLSFTPLFLILTSPLITGELPSITGITGIILIVTGAYFLNIKSISSGILYPFRMIFREPGSIYMLTVALIYSITSNFGKIGVISSSPAFFAATYFTLLSIILIIFIRPIRNIKNIFRKEILIIGFFSSMMIIFHMMAIKLIFVSYMISVKRLSLILGIIYGALFFNEKDIKGKLLGGLIMIAGIIIISFF